MGIFNEVEPPLLNSSEILGQWMFNTFENVPKNIDELLRGKNNSRLKSDMYCIASKWPVAIIILINENDHQSTSFLLYYRD